MIRTTYQRLEVAKEERQKREEIVKRWKTEAIAAKCQRARGRISLSSEEKKNDESDMGDETNPDQINNDTNLLQP